MNRKEFMFKKAFISIILSFEFCFLIYSGIQLGRIQKQLLLAVLFSLVFIMGFVIQKYVCINSPKKSLLFFLSVPVSLVFVFAGSFVFYKLDYLKWDLRDHSAERQVIDGNKDYMFAGKKVMVIVPHEDDEALLMSGVIELYVKYHSDIYVVFQATGDGGVSDSGLAPGLELGRARMQESIDVLTSYGIPEDHIIFLGYGVSSGKHVYNYPDDSDEEIPTMTGIDHTYGTASHPAYRNGEKITKKNLLADYESIITDYKPEIIFCVDYDVHPEHRATGLLFEKVLGKILKQEESYEPVVYKGFNYLPSLGAINDYYYSVNQRSTVNPHNTEYVGETHTYMWEDRVRIPVSVNTLTHYLQSSDTFKKLVMYKTQHGDMYTRINAVVNSDKVYWERRSDSLLYTAKINSSSGDCRLLNNFMLIDSDDVIPGDTDFSRIAGVWIPSTEDAEKTVKIGLREASEIKTIYLYDNPCMDDNVENAKIIFDDGSVIETGKLKPNGSATVIDVNKHNIKSFEIVLTDTTGERAGLTEIEAYSADKKQKAGLIKLMNEQGDFVYDYYLNGRNEISFNLYQYNYDIQLNNDYKVEVSNERITAVISGRQLVVSCPAGQTGFIKVTSPDGLVSDTVRISNKRLTQGFVLGVQLYENYQMPAILIGIKTVMFLMVLLVFIMFLPSGDNERLSLS